MFVECCLHKIWGRGIFDATSKQAIRKVFFMFSTNSHKFFLPWTFPGIWYSIVISQPCSHLWSLVLPDYLKVSLGSKDWPTERFRTAETKCSAIWEEVENLTTVSHHCLISSLAKLKACNEPQVPPLQTFITLQRPVDWNNLQVRQHDLPCHLLTFLRINNKCLTEASLYPLYFPHVEVSMGVQRIKGIELLNYASKFSKHPCTLVWILIRLEKLIFSGRLEVVTIRLPTTNSPTSHPLAARLECVWWAGMCLHCVVSAQYGYSLANKAFSNWWHHLHLVMHVRASLLEVWRSVQGQQWGSDQDTLWPPWDYSKCRQDALRAPWDSLELSWDFSAPMKAPNKDLRETQR